MVGNALVKIAVPAELDQLTRDYPFFYHMAMRNCWPLIREHGLLPTNRLLQRAPEEFWPVPLNAESLHDARNQGGVRAEQLPQVQGRDGAGRNSRYGIRQSLGEPLAAGSRRKRPARRSKDARQGPLRNHRVPLQGVWLPGIVRRHASELN